MNVENSGRVTPLRPSRTAIQTRRDCEMKRFWQFGAFGTGLEPVGVSLPLIGGQTGHAALAPILMGEPVDVVIAEQLTRYAEEVRASGVQGFTGDLDFLIKEQQTLLEGLIRGWVRWRLPLIMEEYEPISAEQEWIVPFADDFQLPLRVDGLLRHRERRTLAIPDLKFISSLRDGWLESKLHDLQTLLYVEGVERVTGEYVEGMFYDSLVKGSRKAATESSPFAGRTLQQSRLCYGYKVESKDAVTYQSDYTARKGARQVAVWEEMPPEDWWAGYLPEETWKELYSTTGLISPTVDERQMVIRQVVDAERRYAKQRYWIEGEVISGEPLTEAVNRHLEPNTQHCYQYGTQYRCPFYSICYEPLVAADPLGSGLYRPRVDHHAVAAVA